MRKLFLLCFAAALAGCESSDIKFGPAEDLGLWQTESDYEGWQTPEDVARTQTTPSAGSERDRVSSRAGPTGPERHARTRNAARSPSTYSEPASAPPATSSSGEGPEWVYVDGQPAPDEAPPAPAPAQEAGEWQYVDEGVEEISIDETGAATVN